VIVVDVLALLYLVGQLSKGIDYVLPAAVLAIGSPVKLWALFLCIPQRRVDLPQLSSAAPPSQP
jgi:hypothetical protein